MREFLMQLEVVCCSKHQQPRNRGCPYLLFKAPATKKQGVMAMLGGVFLANMEMFP